MVLVPTKICVPRHSDLFYLFWCLYLPTFVSLGTVTYSTCSGACTYQNFETNEAERTGVP